MYLKKGKIMANEAPIEKVKIKVVGVEIVLDPENMRFSENNIGEYMNKEYGWYDYLGKQLEFAQKEVFLLEIDAETLYSKKFLESKDAGGTDNYSKAFASSHDEVVDARKKAVEAKETVGHLKAHLRAWDKNHENVQNRGHSLRAEMKVLSRDIYAEQSIEDILGKQ